MAALAPRRLLATALVCALGFSATLAFATEKADPSVEKEEASVAERVWESDLPCTACHTNEAETLEAEELLASKHAALPCTTCHNDGEVLQERHDSPGKRMPTRLKKTEVIDETCLTCHGDPVEAIEETLARGEETEKEQAAAEAVTAVVDEITAGMSSLAAATAESTVLTDRYGTVCNPHALPQNSSHDTIACVDCHNVHDDVTLERRAELTCLNCHHDEVYECGTCHAH